MGALVDEALLGVWGIVLLGIHAPWKLNDYHQNQNRNQPQMYPLLSPSAATTHTTTDHHSNYKNPLLSTPGSQYRHQVHGSHMRGQGRWAQISHEESTDLPKPELTANLDLDCSLKP